jgi:hypothetical protein
MNIYLAERENCDYDEFDALVIVARDETHARLIIASGPVCNGEWDLPADYFSGFNGENYTIKLVGIAFDDVPAGLLLGSFNAG